MKKEVWIISMITFAFVLLTINIIYTLPNEITGRVVSNLKDPSKIHKISINDYEFSIKSLDIKVGDSVAWVNFDDVQHTITSDSGEELNSALLSTREIYHHKFNKKGIYLYYCKSHPYMKATIIVK